MPVNCVKFVSAVLVLNGLYDIVCAASMLWSSNALSMLHPGMFEHISLLGKRLLAYWVFTYGVTRVYAGLLDRPLLGAATFVIEAMCFEYELAAGGSMHKDRVHFVSALSVTVASGIALWVQS